MSPKTGGVDNGDACGWARCWSNWRGATPTPWLDAVGHQRSLKRAFGSARDGDGAPARHAAQSDAAAGVAIMRYTIRVASLAPVLFMLSGACTAGEASDVAIDDYAVGSLSAPSNEDTAQTVLSQEQLLEQLLRELPAHGDAEFLSVRADLHHDLAKLRAAREAAAASVGVGRTAQALTKSDGCTTEWWHDVLLGVAFLHTSDVFFNQCAWHDYCYSSGQAT